MTANLPRSRYDKAVQSSRALRWTLGGGAVAMVAIGLGLLYLLIEATNNREMYEHNYARLFTVNVVVAGILWRYCVGGLSLTGASA